MHPINSYVCTSCLLPMDGNCISDFYLYSSIASLSGTIPTEHILQLSNYNDLYMYVCSYLNFIFPDTSTLEAVAFHAAIHVDQSQESACLHILLAR